MKVCVNFLILLFISETIKSQEPMNITELKESMNLTEQQTKNQQYCHNLIRNLTNENGIIDPAHLDLAKEHISKQIEGFNNLHQIEKLCIHNLFHVHQKLIYPIFINSSYKEIKEDKNSIPHCYEDLNVHEPPPEYHWGPGAIVLVFMAFFGCIMNPIGIWKMKKRTKKSIFNYLTMVLFASEFGYSLFGGASFLIRGFCDVSQTVPIYLYGHFLQPCRTSFINTSMLITLLMCYQRYRSISDPLSYHSEQLIINKGFWAFKAAFCSLLIGWIANLPAFFEFQIIFNFHEYWKKYDNGTSYYPVQESWKMAATSWRWNTVNVFVCRGFVEAFSLLLVPFCCVAYFSIMTAIKLWQRSSRSIPYIRERPSSVHLGVNAIIGVMNPLYHPVTPDDTPIPPPTSPAPVDVCMELESLNSSTVSQNESSQNQESSNASPSNLPSLKEARKVAIIIGVVIFLGIGYVARFTLTIDETISVGYHMIFGSEELLDEHLGCDSAFYNRQYHLHHVANYLLTFNAAFVALLYSFLDTQFFEDLFGSVLTYFGKYFHGHSNGQSIGIMVSEH